MRHVVWDWNGTLFDDLDIVVRSVNLTLEPLGAGPIGADDYRDHYVRPVQLFYDRLLGRPTTASEWLRLDQIFHEAYHDLLPGAALAADAHDALSSVASARHSQSLLSMWWHDRLMPMVRDLGVDAYMARIDGNRDGGAGETKAAHLERHLGALESAGVDISATVVIGDSLDDAVAAKVVGVDAVMYDGGSHHRRELEESGFPVAGTLVEAVSIAIS